MWTVNMEHSMWYVNGTMSMCASCVCNVCTCIIYNLQCDRITELDTTRRIQNDKWRYLTLVLTRLRRISTSWWLHFSTWWSMNDLLGCLYYVTGQTKSIRTEMMTVEKFIVALISNKYCWRIHWTLLNVFSKHWISEYVVFHFESDSCSRAADKSEHDRNINRADCFSNGTKRLVLVFYVSILNLIVFMLEKTLIHFLWNLAVLLGGDRGEIHLHSYVIVSNHMSEWDVQFRPNSSE